MKTKKHPQKKDTLANLQPDWPIWPKQRERLILYYLGYITLVKGKKIRSGGVQAPPLSNKINTYCGRIIFPSIFLLCSFSYTLMVILNQGDQENQPLFQCE